VLPEKNTANLKIQTLRLSAFMIRISSSSTCGSSSIKKLDSSGVLMFGRDLVINRQSPVGNSWQGDMTFSSRESMQARGSFPAEMLAKMDIVITKEGSILQNSTIIKLVLTTANNACGGESISRLAGNTINQGSVDVEQGPGLGIRRDRQVTEVRKRGQRGAFRCSSQGWCRGCSSADSTTGTKCIDGCAREDGRNI
jgi:hypothetical protein